MEGRLVRGIGTSSHVRFVVVSGQSAADWESVLTDIGCTGKFSLSYMLSASHHDRMKRPQLVDLEFAILLFVVGGGMTYSLLRGVFALLR